MYSILNVYNLQKISSFSTTHHVSTVLFFLALFIVDKCIVYM